VPGRPGRLELAGSGGSVGELVAQHEDLDVLGRVGELATMERMPWPSRLDWRVRSVKSGAWTRTYGSCGQGVGQDRVAVAGPVVQGGVEGFGVAFLGDVADPVGTRGENPDQRSSVVRCGARGDVRFAEYLQPGAG
jgi:hypothetical protein